MKGRILVVEDDADLARGLRFNLEHDGYEVVTAGLGREALAKAGAGAFDLVLLDLSLPDVDGTEVLAALRKSGAAVPVICLTARAAETDVVMGLASGADDYVTKPFGLAELRARIEAVRRRTGERQGGTTLQLGGIGIDLRALRAVHPDRVEELTPAEADILRYLATRRGEAVERQDMLRDLWGLDRRATTRTLDNHVARLRKKIERDPESPRWLVTVHGVGYRLEKDGTGS